ncbi:MAG: universal stress protein [Deltaproteobacteria bacterium]|nr:universal stress protein [Deltaproteobacteria bacterium]
MGEVDPGKNILLSIDNSENSRRAIRYVANIVGSSGDYLITILNIIEDMGEDFFPSAEERQNHIEKQKQTSAALLAEARNIMREYAVPEECIRTEQVTAPSAYIAESIIRHAQHENKGTVVVGRRGISKKEEFLFGSVSSKIVSYAKDCTVWVVE